MELVTKSRVHLQEVISSEKARYHEAKGEMSLLKVVKKEGMWSTSFELYDCSGPDDRFIMAGVCDRYLMGVFVITSLLDAHTKSMDDIQISSYSSTYLGQVRRTGSVGLGFSVCDDRHNQVALINFKMAISRRPISFTIDLLVDSLSEVKRDIQSTLMPQWEARCTHVAPGYGRIQMETKDPIWNSEINTWVHNFGCRVKKASNCNFLLVRSPESKDYSLETEEHMSETATYDASSRICIRYGKVKEDEYVLDFRDPISPFIALATLCAVHAWKPLVSTDH